MNLKEISSQLEPPAEESMGETGRSTRKTLERWTGFSSMEPSSIVYRLIFDDSRVKYVCARPEMLSGRFFGVVTKIPVTNLGLTQNRWKSWTTWGWRPTLPRTQFFYLHHHFFSFVTQRQKGVSFADTSTKKLKCRMFWRQFYFGF